MAALVCEICGGKLMAKSGGLFECEYCGMQYDKTRVQEMVQEIKGTVKVEGTVEVKGTVNVDGSVKVEGAVSKENLVKLAKIKLENAFIGRGWSWAPDSEYHAIKELLEQALVIDPEYAEAYLYMAVMGYSAHNVAEFQEKYVSRQDKCKNFDLFCQFAKGELAILAEEIRSEYKVETIRQEAQRAEEERQRAEAERQRKEQEKKKAENKRMQWERGREIAAGLKGIFANSENHFVYLKQDGTVCAYGQNTHGECDVGSWENVVSVAAGEFITVGVRADGSVLYAGDHRLANTVRNWKSIQSVKTLNTNTHPLVVGLHEDGSVSATHEYVSFYRNGRFLDEKRTDTQDAVKSWHDIVAIACGGHHVLGLESDRTVLATGRNDELQCTLYMWEDIIAVEGGMYHSVGLKPNGTVVVQGSNHSGECRVEEWKDIVDIAAGPGITVGLCADGTIIMAGSTKYYSAASFWENIVAIAFGGSSVLYGIKADGTIEAAGGSVNSVPMPKDIKLFDDAEHFVKERSQKHEEMKRIMEEQRIKELADKKAALQKEQEQLNARLPELKGIFANMQRKKIESRLVEIETELKGME